MNASKIIALVLVAFAIFFLVTEPTTAATVVRAVGGALQDGASAAGTFVRNLFT